MTKRQLREAICRIIKQELKNTLSEYMPVSAKKAFKKNIKSDPDYIDFKKKIRDRYLGYLRQTWTPEVPKASDRYVYLNGEIIDNYLDINDDNDSVEENAPAPAPSKPKETPGPAVAPGKPDTGKPVPRRPLGNPNVKPAPKATMTEADILAKIIKRFKAKKNV